LACAAITVSARMFLDSRDSGMTAIDPSYAITVREAVKNAAQAYQLDPAFLPIRDGIWQAYQARSFRSIPALEAPLLNAVNVCVAAFPAEAGEYGWSDVLARF